MAAAPAAAAESVEVEGPAAHGVVRFGQRVKVGLSGPCKKASSRITVRFGDVVLAGRRVRGCRRTVTVPSERLALREGYVPGHRVTVALTSGGTTTPLVFWRHQPTARATVTDPFEKRNGAELSTGESLDLGRVHLEKLQSVSVRNLATAPGLWEIRAGTTSGPTVARGFLGALGSLTSAGANGWYHAVGAIERGLHDLLGLKPVIGDAPRLFFVMVLGSATVNFVDFNGPGAGLPHAFASDKRFKTLFDGSSFDGWGTSAPVVSC